ncbi:PREDICTED: L-asparaginase-like [Amphimedon queenslandica]|uniref:asparaginase n=1 Tax=Amphimedon queenslandica TaxID=400682 RepID=A0AAN0JVG9_AMPQE|nr:PREDICTED: L-asparaginase-like [Amphimedon queenslandica]|eukprot:XP_019860890.1 PREDICTED: L-asparaginase-like [Amphimedon queenslandica]
MQYGTIRDVHTRYDTYICSFSYYNPRLLAEIIVKLFSFVPFPLFLYSLTIRNYRILYGIKEYTPLLDSSNMSMTDWAYIASDIRKYYAKFDAFVILHGTDTMAYTASALSFMLENLGKTIILTGSQIPLSELRSDGRDNLLESLIIAGEFVIPEVLLYFNNKLFRGNRTVKMNSSRLDAFSSPNFPPIARVGVDIKVNWESVFRPSSTEKFSVHSDMNSNVGILRLFPGISKAAICSFLQPPMEGVVLQSYGAGNIPDSRSDIVQELSAATERGVIIVNCSQCFSGYVSEKYAAGLILRDANVIPGYDMTPEASLTKLSYLLSRSGLSLEEKRKLMEENLRGEKTVINEQSDPQSLLNDTNLLRSLTKLLTSNTDVKLLRESLFPSLLCKAASEGDLEALKTLKKEGGDVAFPDYTGLTPLHLAARRGHYDTVHYLLVNGASVHMKDSLHRTPLHEAISFKQLDIIKLLVQTGAHINETPTEIGSKLCLAASVDDVKLVEAWRLAGADMKSKDYSGNTASSIAQEGSQVSQYLAKIKCKEN